MASVAVLMPVRLPAPYLEEAMDSVLAQSLPPTEIIVAAHGCGEDLAYLEHIDGRIHVVSVAANAHFAAVLNAGLERATAEFIARLDADDLAHADRFACQEEQLSISALAAVCATPVNLIDESGRSLDLTYPCLALVPRASDLLSRNLIAHSSVMFKRDIALAIGGYRGLALCEDYDLWLRLLATHELAYVRAAKTDYRVHAGQVTARRGVPPSAWTMLWHSRKALAQTRGIPWVNVAGRHLAWCLAQVALSLGLRRSQLLNGAGPL